ncbi:hypothetical protein D1Z97_06640 [Riemerella anatipestifer]|uniref:hypothetical protein n=1 Tax=Riemerella anatipestifer TaxID=34085 RepID=UPI00129D33A1|nr:hypothetical protein [Riemerella anatipestifer]MRM96688.1 hypothetical protein [Riemerella anatipestifer]MRN00865.1 hypothetical protein [Riemerella anatipestifer]MRN02977.1 hypothetical protein [Riemerella anatipestifer]
MKKLLLVAMLGVAGVMSAKGKQVKNVKNVQNLQRASELVMDCEAKSCGSNCIELNCTVRRK